MSETGGMSGGFDASSAVAVPDTLAFDIRSTVNGRRYRIAVSRPWGPLRRSGYAALVVLDSHQYFASAVAAIRNHPTAAHVAVIGIGYPKDEDWVEATLAAHGAVPASLAGVPLNVAACELERFFDLTTPADAATLAAESVVGLWSAREDRVGGLDGFLATLAGDVLEAVAARLPIDPSDIVLFGHSLGGLAVLRALFLAPSRYRAFVASSPAIWWNDCAILNDELAFHEAVLSGAARPQVIVSAGAGEAYTRLLPPALADMQAMLVSRRVASRMIDNARELTERLSALAGRAPYRVEDFVLHPDVSHGLVPWASLARGIALTFPAAVMETMDV